MPDREPLSKAEMSEISQNARALLRAYRVFKDEFASAYHLKDYLEMNAKDKEIRRHVRQFADLFAHPQGRRKRQTSMDLKNHKEFRADKRIVAFVAKLRALANHMDRDVSEINLYEFRHHVDQAEKTMLQLIYRMRDIKKRGVNDCRRIGRPPKQTPRIRENFEDWTQWIQEEKKAPKSETEEMLKHLDELTRPRKKKSP